MSDGVDMESAIIGNAAYDDVEIGMYWGVRTVTCTGDQLTIIDHKLMLWSSSLEAGKEKY